jgi:serine/threonine protein kinase
MDTSINPQNPREKPEIAKTFVEGPDAKTGVHGLPTGSRLDATQVGATNPYARQAAAQPASADNLPSGNEPLALGSGTIVGLLGAGGMARVYKIWNDKLEVFRAVKILIPTQQGDLRNRFETEAKITAKLRHPNIVEIYNVGDFGGLPFLEMELIDGSSLDAIIGSMGKLPPQVCSAIAIFVARALAYAHNQDFLLYGKTYHGIIHRDLKPANIMISKHGDLRLMDFGIARPTEASLHTVEGNIVGTMQYLSPEQMDGVDIDSRADLYAFGAILYEMLTGTKTFPQDTITNLMKKKIMNEYRKFDEFDFSIPSVLAKISQKCLQLEKENRYPSAQALLDDLDEAHASLTSDSPETVLKAYIANPSSISKTTKAQKTFPLPLKIVLPAAGVVVVAALATVFLVTGPKPARQAPAAAAQQPAPSPPAVTQPVPEQQLQPLSPQPVTPAQPPATAPEEAAAPTPREPERRPMPQHVRQAPRVSPPAEKGTAPAASSPEALKKKYRSDDPVAAGQAALSQGSFEDAVAILESVPASSPQHAKALLLEIDALIQSDKLRAAKEKLLNNRVDDAEYYLLSGEMYQRMGRNKDAIDNLQTALTKPSAFRNVRDVRNDALYFTAVAYGELYKDEPSQDNRGLALQSWRVVKNMYAASPGSGRFKRAVDELANIK